MTRGYFGSQYDPTVKVKFKIINFLSFGLYSKSLSHE